jgi:lambda family phage portal protein
MASPVKAPLIDRLIGVVAPQAALKRASARAALDVLQRGYDGASKGRGTAGWRSTKASADAIIGSEVGLLRDRSRDLVRNSALAAQAVQVLVNNIVGYGIAPRPAGSNRAVNKRAAQLWAEWSKKADYFGHADFNGLTALAVRMMIESGDALALRMMGAVKGSRVPLQVMLREPDHLDEARMISAADGWCDMGIEYDQNGRRRAYWMFPDHPGGMVRNMGRRFQSERVPAAQVAHLFERQRMQSRGVPWVAPSLIAMNDMTDWQRAEMVRKKLEACTVGVVFGDEDPPGLAPQSTDAGAGGAAVVDSFNNPVESFEPGMIAYARGGKSVQFHTPSPTAGIGEWSRVQMHMIAAGFRVPYALMTGDMSQANFSSARVGLNEFRRMVTMMQWLVVIPMFCQPVWDWFVEACQLAGLLPADASIPAEWDTPRFEMVNPLQDVQADLVETRAGFASPQQMIAKRGYDPETVWGEWKDFAAAVDEMKLIFDTDPRRVTKVGQQQQAGSGGDDGAASQDGAVSPPANGD